MNKQALNQARLYSLAFVFLASSAGKVIAQPGLVDLNVQQAPVDVEPRTETGVPVNPTASQPVAGVVPNSQATVVQPIAVPEKPKSQKQVSGELFYQLQLLQEEVMFLRGQLEEQGGELQRLKQQRLDDYLVMDRRMSLLEQGAVTETPVAETNMPAVTFGANGAITATSAPASTAAPATLVAAETEETSNEKDFADADKVAYKAAYGLIKSRQLEEAELAFEKFLVDYQGSPYCANAYYWLGELYDRKGKMDKARAAFVNVLEQYPDSNKVPDALYKLGKVYHQLGDNVKAQEYLNAVISKYGNTSRTSVKQAQEYLKKNFSGNG